MKFGKKSPDQWEDVDLKAGSDSSDCVRSRNIRHNARPTDRDHSRTRDNHRPAHLGQCDFISRLGQQHQRPQRLPSFQIFLKLNDAQIALQTKRENFQISYPGQILTVLWSIAVAMNDCSML